MNDISELAAALNGHQITDEQGQIPEETETSTESAPDEKTTVEETPQTEEVTPEVEETKADTEETDPDHAVDETGKRYVPESRFKEIYGKSKQTERELAEERKKRADAEALLLRTSPVKSKDVPKVDKAEVLELKMTLPQFDPKPDEYGTPTNPDYSPELDQLGFTILKANPGMTALQAGYQAIQMARGIAKKEGAIKSEARIVKTLQSDQGITSRVVSRQEPKVDVDSMSDKELEKYLKETGQW